MSASRIASVAAVVGGLVWVVAAMSDWGGTAGGLVYDAGMVVFGVALAGLGYALVATAPVWLRAVVTVATPALGYMVWVTVESAFGYGSLPVLVAGVLMVVLGGVGMTRHQEAKPVAAVRGRRAAR